MLIRKGGIMKRTYWSLLAVLCICLFAQTAWASVSYLGPAGTYTEEATVQFFGTQEEMSPANTVAESLALLKAGKCSYAVVPVENTIGGPVYAYVDAVLAEPEFTVVGEVNLPIRQTLLGLPGTSLQQVKTVLSHPQGIAQSKAWLKANLPEAKVTEVSSTAEGAKKVAEAQDPSVAAIAASRTADVYHLDILARDLQYTDTNVTRFWVVAPKEKALSAGKKGALALHGSTADLGKLLVRLENMGYQVEFVHDRPLKTKLGEYLFVLEVKAAQAKTPLEQAVRGSSGQVRVLGVYDEK